MEKHKLIGVIDEDPFDHSTWSGSSHYFFRELDKVGVLEKAYSAEPGFFAKNLSKLRNVDPDIKKWKFKYHLDHSLFKSMSKVARKKIQYDNVEFDVVCQIGAWYDLSRNDKVNVSYHDGNLATLLSSPYKSPAISRSIINRALNWEKKLYEKMDRIFPMSSWLAKSFVNDFGVSESKVMPVGAGINLSRIADSKGRSYNNPTILMVGKDFERKGGKYLLEAFRMIKKEIPDATLRLVGPKLNNLPDGVESVGFIQKNTESGLKRLLDEYMNASLFVLPSLYEPFGISFAEAMAHRLPCVGTNICAMPEIISNGNSGYVVTPGDSRALAKVIIEILKDTKQCKEMGEKGYLEYKQSYNWPAVVQKILDNLP
ncbi:glycosyltransferase family 4 protein [Porticoccus sp. GXU_MW_L64]